ncbi:MAG: hypothetical protein KJ710_04415 [Candidatus Omnitrophica bacterium]|nr:hypothetical protein [Candidatus Omnitrophota bacterium]MBU1923483.1 hypothetical protein [Candidatus Omnitrophota bacterium]
MLKKVVLISRLFFLVFCGIGIFLLISNFMLRKSLQKISKSVAIIKDKDSQRHKKLQENIRSGMEEKYRADMISYRVVAKRLEQEQDRQNNLREETGQAEKAKQGLQKGGGR